MRIVTPLVFVVGLVAALVGNAVLGETYPSKPVHLIVTYPPAGSSDLMARILAQKLSDLWGQPVIVENKPGAAGSIGMDYAAHQPADGYNLWEAPDNVSMAAVAIAIGGGGALSKIETTPLLTVEETLQALGRARAIAYRPPGA